MSRWTYNVPRVVLAVILLTVASLGVAPAVRWSLTNRLQSTIEGVFTAEQTQASLGDGKLHVRQAAVSSSDAPDEKLIEVDRATLQVDLWALACRRVVITEGELEGVRLHSGAAPPTCSRNAAQTARADAAASLGRAWRRRLRETPTLPAELQGVAEARRIKQERMADLESIADATTDWQAQFDELDELTRVVGDNPLRMTPAYRKRLEELSRVGEHIDQLNEQFTSLRRTIQEDRLQLSRLQAEELEALQGDASLTQISPDDLSNYLLEKDWSERVGAWVQWVRDSRRLVRVKPERSQFVFTNSRGVDVMFNAGRKPDFRVDNLYLQGTGQLGAETFRFRGTLNNVSDEPALAAKPTILTLAAEGAGAVQMDAVIDRSQPSMPIDRIRVLCPVLPTQRTQWGRPEEFAVEAGESTLRMTLVLDIRGEDIGGTLEFAQTGVELTPAWPAEQLDDSLSDVVQSSLQDIQEVEGAVELSGTLDHPVWELYSSLGRDVTRSIQRTLDDKMQRRSSRLIAEYQAAADQELDELVKLLEQRESAVRQQLAQQSQELDEFRRRVSQREDLMDRLVRNAGPLENLLR